MSLARYQHMTPLMVAVRQLSADVAAELLQAGAATQADAAATASGRSRAARCRPILLQLLDATAEAAAQAAAAAAGPGPELNPAGGPGPAAAPAACDTRSMSGGAGSAAAASTAAAAAAGSAAVLDASRAVLAVLLAHGADPLEQDQTTSRQPTTFMSGEAHPVVVVPAVACSSCTRRLLEPDSCQCGQLSITGLHVLLGACCTALHVQCTYIARPRPPSPDSLPPASHLSCRRVPAPFAAASGSHACAAAVPVGPRRGRPPPDHRRVPAAAVCGAPRLQRLSLFAVAYLLHTTHERDQRESSNVPCLSVPNPLSACPVVPLVLVAPNPSCHFGCSPLALCQRIHLGQSRVPLSHCPAFCLCREPVA